MQTAFCMYSQLLIRLTAQKHMLLSHCQSVCQAGSKVGAVQVMRFAEAKDDCDSALKLELNVKTLLRRGTSWLGLQEIDSARKDFKHVLSLEPNNRCDNHLLLTMECFAACVALTLLCDYIHA